MFDTRLVWLLASALTLVAIGVGAVDAAHRISSLPPLSLGTIGTLLLVMLLFLDDTERPFFWLVRDLPRLVLAVALAGLSWTATVLLVISLAGDTTIKGGSPEQTARLLQAVFTLGLGLLSALVAWTLARWAWRGSLASGVDTDQGGGQEHLLLSSTAISTGVFSSSPSSSSSYATPSSPSYSYSSSSTASSLDLAVVRVCESQSARASFASPDEQMELQPVARARRPRDQ